MKSLFVGWVLIGGAGAALCVLPFGQRWRHRLTAESCAARARAAAERGDWAEVKREAIAITTDSAAEEDLAIHTIGEIWAFRAQHHDKDAVGAITELEKLTAKIEKAKVPDEVREAAQEELAAALYTCAWCVRGEGALKEEWRQLNGRAIGILRKLGAELQEKKSPDAPRVLYALSAASRFHRAEDLAGSRLTLPRLCE